MALDIDSWLSQVKTAVSGRSSKGLYEEYFFRDPLRCISRDSNALLSPSDGILYSIKEFASADSDIVIKGVRTTPRGLLPGTRPPEGGIIFDFFMTTYDVHVLRAPASGYIRTRHAQPHRSLNTSMLDFEEAIIRTREGNVPAPCFLQLNQRVISDLYVPHLDVGLHIVQIADSEINAITPFAPPGWSPISQGDRFSAIRLGSQVSLVMRFGRGANVKVLVKENFHYEAGEPLGHFMRDKDV